MYRIVLRHLSGSKANQVEQFPLSQHKELIVGRDAAANVQFADTDVVVGRQHLKLAQNPANPAEFLITDLSSRNGTYLNRHRVVGMAVLKPGDVVQCGVNGPEFRFELEPETESLGSERRPAPTSPANLSPPVRPAAPPADSPLAHLASAARPPANAAPARPAAPVAEATVARAAEPRPELKPEPKPEPKIEKSNRPLLIGGGVLMGLVVLVAGFFSYRSFTATETNGTTKTTSTPLPNTAAATANPAPNVAAGEAEKDAQRAVWRIEVAPYLALGSGHPGKAASDFDKPDGVGFSPKGVLFATDAKNRRVQVWDVKTGARLGEFGHGVFGGEIVDVAVAPDETVYITDQSLNLAYTFVPPAPGALDEKGKPLGPYDYQFKGTRFGEQGFKKLGGIAIDSRGRIYVVDAHRNKVFRFNPDNTVDKTFKFEQNRGGVEGDTYLHGCEGIAIDESAGNLFIASEKDAVVEVFDWETGAYKHRLVGASLDAAEKPAGKHVFFGSVEGLTFARRHLLAVDESAGHIQIFNLDSPDVFNHDLAEYAAPQPNRPSGYQGFFGHGPLVNFEDKENLALQKQVKLGSVLPGQANPPGYFCSPDSIASYTDAASGETYIAIADQCNYRLIVYRWSDIGKALGQPITVAEVKPASVAAAKETVTPAAATPVKQASVAHTKVAAKHANVAPTNTRAKPVSATKPVITPKPVAAPADNGGKKKKKKDKHPY